MIASRSENLIFLKKKSLESIADAIRNKTGYSGKYTPAEMDECMNKQY